MRFWKQYQSGLHGMLLILTDNLDNRLRFSHCLGVLRSVCGDRSSLFISRQCQSKKSKKGTWTRVWSSKCMTNYIAKLNMVITWTFHTGICVIIFCIAEYGNTSYINKKKKKKNAKEQLTFQLIYFKLWKQCLPLQTCLLMIYFLSAYTVQNGTQARDRKQLFGIVVPKTSTNVDISHQNFLTVSFNLITTP